ncbi:MAG: GNAT family N-acetyltransferase [Clostridia bacterium]|nr:GNAT family N-acetyltransferase [Clostridia bacterium]
MEYLEPILLKDGRLCILRSGTDADGEAALENFIRTHEQTDYLLSYPDEIRFTAAEEGEFLRKKTESADEVEILAEVDGKIIGLAGIGRVGGYEKVARRAEFGVSVDREYWGLGVGRALTRACIACAKRAGYAQLELDVVADNERAAALYRSEGFVVYGTNPRGFYSRLTGWQPLTLMRLELDDVSIPESRSTETV